MFYTYILYNLPLDSYYVGSSNNLEDRLYRHNKGQSKSTKRGAPNWELVYSKSFESRSEAYQFELKIKKMKSRKYIKQLIKSD